MADPTTPQDRAKEAAEKQTAAANTKYNEEMAREKKFEQKVAEIMKHFYEGPPWMLLPKDPNAKTKAEVELQGPNGLTSFPIPAGTYHREGDKHNVTVDKKGHISLSPPPRGNYAAAYGSLLDFAKFKLGAGASGIVINWSPPCGPGGGTPSFQQIKALIEAAQDPKRSVALYFDDNLNDYINENFSKKDSDWVRENLLKTQQGPHAGYLAANSKHSAEVTNKILKGHEVNDQATCDTFVRKVEGMGKNADDFKNFITEMEKVENALADNELAIETLSPVLKNELDVLDNGIDPDQRKRAAYRFVEAEPERKVLLNTLIEERFLLDQQWKALNEKFNGPAGAPAPNFDKDVEFQPPTPAAQPGAPPPVAPPKVTYGEVEERLKKVGDKLLNTQAATQTAADLTKFLTEVNNKSTNNPAIPALRDEYLRDMKEDKGLLKRATKYVGEKALQGVGYVAEKVSNIGRNIR